LRKSGDKTGPAKVKDVIRLIEVMGGTKSGKRAAIASIIIPSSPAP
jgi:hypothetical protein